MITQPQTTVGLLVLKRVDTVGRALELVHQIGIAALEGDSEALIDLQFAHHCAVASIAALDEQIAAAKKELAR